MEGTTTTEPALSCASNKPRSRTKALENNPGQQSSALGQAPKPPPDNQGRPLRGRWAKSQMTSKRRSALQHSQLAHSWRLLVFLEDNCGHWVLFQTIVWSICTPPVWEDTLLIFDSDFQQMGTRLSSTHWFCLILTPCLHHDFWREKLFCTPTKSSLFFPNFYFHSASKIIKLQCCRQLSNRNFDTLF